MNTLKLKLNKTVVVVLLALTLVVGYGVGGPVLGLDLIPHTHACGGANNGGGC